MRLYVGNLSYRITEQQLRDAFAEYGEVTHASIVTDRATGQSKGFGFVEMASAEDGQAAVNALNGKPLQGRALRIDEARPRGDRGH